MRRLLSEELKPCPFCGKPAKAVYFEEHDAHQAWCTNAECVVMPEVDWKGASADEIAAVWNKRPVEDALAVRLDWHSGDASRQPETEAY